jgi:AraC-like DNA-binding protein
MPPEYWHVEPELPRPWIVLPVEVRQEALSRPLSKHVLPSHVGFFPKARRHSILRVAGTTSTIFKYCIQGNGWGQLGGRTFDVGPGDLLVLPIGEPHAYGSSAIRPWTIHWFHAVGDDVQNVLRELEIDLEHPVAHLGKSPELVGLFEELAREMAAGCAPRDLLYASQLLTHLLGVMIRLRSTARDHRPDARSRVLQTIAHLRNRPQLTLSTDEAASMADLSVSQFSALFRELTGESPKRFATRIKMIRARQLLADTGRTVQRISGELGFSDPLYFSRLFRSVNKISPSEFRKAAGRKLVHTDR